MKLGLKYGLALSLTLPVGCALAAEQLKDDRASALQALEAITSQESEAPALLLLTPSQLNAISPPAERKVSTPPANTETRESAALQAQIKQLNAALAQRDQELRQLRQAARQDADARAEVSQLKQTLQDNLQATEQMQQDMVAAATAKGENSNENGRLQQALDQSRQQSSALQKQLATLAKAHTDNSQENKALQAALNESRQQAEQAQQAAKTQGKSILQIALDESLHNQMTMLKVTNEQQQVENRQLQQRLLATQQREAIEPKSELEIRDYAIGSSLAEDMLALLKERAVQGIEVDTRLALAGVQDTFAGKPKLQQEQIDKALDASEKMVHRNQQQQKLDIEKAGARYIEQFAKQKQVKKEALGYFYRIDKAGKGSIGENNMISVVVKESLINGKVVKDMEAAGTSITQLLSSYPPIFRTAISKLQNHGSITMVVPPSLAYGDKGLPPDIPPGSTMIYNVRILETTPGK